jgi:hypothetical protein
MEWASRKVLAWKLSNTMDMEFCIEALEDAIRKYGKPDIFNTDQGSQFTSPRFTRILKDANVRISMDGKGPLDGQRLHRATVAITEIRVRLPACVREWNRGSVIG